jgi:thymidine phosphorylase
MVGETAVQLGAGREKKGDPIDYAVGIEILHTVGDQIKEGEPLFVVHASDARRLADARRRLLKAHEWSQVPVEPLPLFYGVIQK